MSFILRGIGGLIRLSGVTAQAGTATKAATTTATAAARATSVVSQLPTRGAQVLRNLRNVNLRGYSVGKTLPTKLRPAASNVANISRTARAARAARTGARAGTAKKVAVGAGLVGAGGAAVAALRSSGTARTVAKIVGVGGGLAGAGLLAGEGLKAIGGGIEKAVVEPFEDLGLVENVDTDGDGVPDSKQLTTTGKIVVYGAIAAILTGIGAYIITAVKK